MTPVENRMRPELVVFDMAGTTVYDGDAVNHCLAAALHGADVRATRDEVNAVMGIAKPIAIQTLLTQKAQKDVSPERVQAIYADFLARMLTHYRTHPDLREIEGASETFRALRTAGIKIALDTGFSREVADAILDRLCWQKSDLLNATVTSDEVARGRPYPDLILRAMSLTGVTDTARVAKVGDTPSDLQQGTAAGCGWVIGVTEGSHTAEELKPHPHTHLLSTVAALPALFAL